MYIIRTAFWLSVVVLLLPIGGEDPDMQAGDPVEQTGLSAGDALDAAIATVGDVAGLCARKPEVCDAGGAAWETFQMKARYGANWLYRWAQGDEAESENGAADGAAFVRESANRHGSDKLQTPFRVSENTAPIYTGSSKRQKMANGDNIKGPRSKNTLRIEDLIPEWKGPAKPARA